MVSLPQNLFFTMWSTELLFRLQSSRPFFEGGGDLQVVVRQDKMYSLASLYSIRSAACFAFSLHPTGLYLPINVTCPVAIALRLARLSLTVTYQRATLRSPLLLSQPQYLSPSDPSSDRENKGLIQRKCIPTCQGASDSRTMDLLIS